MSRPAPRTGPLAALVVAATTSAGALRRGRLVGLSILVGLPVLIRLAVLIWGGGRDTGFRAYAELVDVAYLNVIVPLMLIFLGTAAFGDEWEAGTGPYVLGVPVSRPAIVIGRWLAAAGRALALLLPAHLLVFALCVLPHEGAVAHYLPHLFAVLGVLVLLALGYLAVFMLFGLALRRCVMLSLFYVLLFEVAVGRLPPFLARFSLSFHARNLMASLTGMDVFSEHLLVPQGQSLPATSWSFVAFGAYLAVALSLSVACLFLKQVTGEVVVSEE